MTDGLWQLAYVSSAVRPMTAPDFEAIVRVSVERNQEHGITGMLGYSQGSFFQILEGSEEAVTERYRHIARDVRHHDLVLLMSEPARIRAFPDWSMGPIGGSLDLFSESDDVSAVLENLRPVFTIDEPRIERMLARFHSGLLRGQPPEAGPDSASS